MMGQIATFMDVLHLTYDEVTQRIPYRNLVIMQKDKLRPTYKGRKEETTEDDFNIHFQE